VKKKFMRIISAVLCIFFIFSVFMPQVFAESDVIDTENSLTLTAKSALLMDADTGKVLYEYNADERLGPASVTKIMTLLLAAEAIDRGDISLDDTVTASKDASGLGGSQIYLKEGEQMSVRDIFKSVVIASANDAAYALGEHIAGSGDAFVAMMNKRADELGMENTHFLNPHGLDEDGHYTSARDIAIMSRELMSHEMIYDYTTIRTDSVRGGEFGLTSTNKLLGTYNGITGLKTGSTSTTLFSMSATAKRDGVSLIAVVMAAETGAARFEEAAKLLDYGFANYKRYNIIKDEESFTPLSVNHGQTDFLPLTISHDFGATVKNTDIERLEKKIILPETIDAPVSKGEQVGLIVLSLDGKTVLEVPVIADESIDKLTMKFSMLTLMNELFTRFWS